MNIDFKQLENDFITAKTTKKTKFFNQELLSKNFQQADVSDNSIIQYSNLYLKENGDYNGGGFTIANTLLQRDIWLIVYENENGRIAKIHIFNMQAGTFSIDDFKVNNPHDFKKDNEDKEEPDKRGLIIVPKGNGKFEETLCKKANLNSCWWKTIDFTANNGAGALLENPDFMKKPEPPAPTEPPASIRINPNIDIDYNALKERFMEAYEQDKNRIQKHCKKFSTNMLEDIFQIDDPFNIKAATQKNPKKPAGFTIPNELLYEDMWLIIYGLYNNQLEKIYIFNVRANTYCIADFKTNNNRDFNENNEDKEEKSKRGIKIMPKENGKFDEQLHNKADLNKCWWKTIDFTANNGAGALLENPDFIEEEPVSEEEYQRRRKELMDGLTAEQKAAAITDAPASLVIAGAGCGKTHTLMGRVVHLYETGKIKSADDLLLVVFNRKNRIDLRKKLKYYGYSEKSAYTFHALGLVKVLKQSAGIDKECVDPDKGNLLDDIITKLFIDAEYQSDNKNDYNLELRHYFKKAEKLKEQYNWEENLYRWSAIKKPEDLLGNVYSALVPNETQRLRISFLEACNISLDTTHYHYTDMDIRKLRLFNYLLLIGYKPKDIQHMDNAKKYIEISSERLYWDRLDLETNFNGIKKLLPPSKKLSEAELSKTITTAFLNARSVEFKKVATLFITLCKTYQRSIADLPVIEAELLDKCPNGHTPEEADTCIYCSKIKAFFQLITPIYQLYNAFLKEYEILDFNDMINESIGVLNNQLKADEYKHLLQYKYILVDEFQDIAQDNLNLIKTLKERSNANIMCVGDDWQSIYSWRGSDLRFFTHYDETFNVPDYEELKITQTFRYGKKLASVSSKFITKNPYQKKKNITSQKPETDLISAEHHQWDQMIDHIQKTYGKNISLNVLVRTHKDTKRILNRDQMELKEELREIFAEADIMTIHKSKGLEADVIIILNLVEGSFPSRQTTDPVLKYFSDKYNRSEEDYPHAEERRLFYVAMTRAKKACYFFLPGGSANSTFWDDIEEETIPSQL